MVAVCLSDQASYTLEKAVSVDVRNSHSSFEFYDQSALILTIASLCMLKALLVCKQATRKINQCKPQGERNGPNRLPFEQSRSTSELDSTNDGRS